MKEYFVLQYKMINRKMIDIGLNPIVGFCLISAVFVGFSFYLFLKTEFAEYIYILIGLSFVYKLSEKKRNDFLKSIFLDTAYMKLRLIENSIVGLLFIVFLAYKELYSSAIILTTLSLIMVLVNFSSTFNYTIPTPFHKRPFEFTVGFRNTFYLFAFSYFLTFMSVSVGNFNLGVFALLLTFFIALSFYLKPENEYYVWTFVDAPKRFLMNKIKIGLVYSTILSAPILIVLSIFFISEINTLIIFQLIGYVYLITIILAKYSAYPDEMNLPQGILIALTFILPPMIFVIIPLFYLQSIKKLNPILE